MHSIFKILVEDSFAKISCTVMRAMRRSLSHPEQRKLLLPSPLLQHRCSRYKQWVQHPRLCSFRHNLYNRHHSKNQNRAMTKALKSLILESMLPAGTIIMAITTRCRHVLQMTMVSVALLESKKTGKFYIFVISHTLFRVDVQTNFFPSGKWVSYTLLLKSSTRRSCGYVGLHPVS